jgi:non-specific serine/threonine protein kinase
MKPSQLTFGPFQLDPIEHSLWRGSERLAVAPKPFALLQYFARHPGRLATKEELLEAVWPNVHVGDAVLKTCVAELRHVLSDEAEAPRFIETVLRHGYRFVAPVVTSNLPARVTSFVGRERELLEVKRLVASSRLVTLLGPAGVGKTSLAIRVAADLLPELPHGACWVDLTPLNDPDHVAQIVATALGVRDQSRLPMIETLADALQERQMLLVLDNCEHLIDACASLVESLMRACTHIKILATSREPLSVDREVAWLVPALSVPDPEAALGDLLACEAGRLFVERASESSPSFSLTALNTPAIADICRRLDGLPLAIELAAVRVKVISPEQIAARLDDALGLLGTVNRTRQARHQTLARAIDWSYDLLTVKERLALAILSVFAGSFTLAAAESVCAASGELDTTEVLDLITGLVDRSLVTVVNQAPFSEKRYRLLETIRQYAHKKIPPQLEACVSKSHAEFFASVAEEIESSINTSIRDECLVRLDREYGHLRAALEWSRTAADGRQLGLRIAGALWLYWMHRGHWGGGRIWLELMLATDRESPAAVRAKALCGAGTLAYCQGDDELARLHLTESVALWRKTNDTTRLAFALFMLGEVQLQLGDAQSAGPVLRESIAVLRGAPPDWHLAVALNHLGSLARCEGRPEEAISFHEDSADIMRSINDAWGLAIPLRNLALLAASSGQYDRAEACCREALLALRRLEDRWFVALTLEVAATISCSRGLYVEAARLLGAAEKLRETIGAPLAKSRRANYEAVVRRLQTALTDASLRASWTAGRALSRDEAIALATAPSRYSTDGCQMHRSLS